MKAKLTLLFIALTTFCYSQIIVFPDINLKNKLLQADVNNQIAKNISGSFFKVDSNNDGEIQVNEALQVSYLDFFCQTCPENEKIISVEGIHYFTNLEEFYCGYNKINSVNLTGLTQLTHLGVEHNELTSLDVSNLTQLTLLGCFNNQIQDLDISALLELNRLDCSFNVLTSLYLGNNTKLDLLNCNNNQLTGLNIQHAINLSQLCVQFNQLSSLIFDGIDHLFALTCYNNQLSTLFLNNLNDLGILQCQNNQLVSLFIKNGSLEDANSLHPLSFGNNAGLKYICCDPAQENRIKTMASGIPGCEVNSYCTFYPGNDYALLDMNVKIDANLNGCDSADRNVEYIKVYVNNGIITDYFVTNSLGNLSIPLEYNIYTITPVLNNPAYFSVEPGQVEVSFPASTNPYIQNFCLQPNNIHNDMEVVILPVNIARPGFDIMYKIVYKNNGTSIQNGSINFIYNDTIIEFISSVPGLTNQAPDMLTWDFSNLLPLEQREIDVKLNLNSPVEIPAVNSGDIINYSAAILGLTDETPADNTATINQIVVNSNDPNDKICLEGSIVSPELIGEYVRYMIRFENNGTANALRVIVKDIIDPTKFDINSLIPIKGSHPFETIKTFNNKIEFIFPEINLPFDDDNNDGFVAFKIKILPGLTSSDMFSNSANIYFDYNMPIVTNNYITQFQTLGVHDTFLNNEFSVYPNPVKDVLSFSTKENIFKIEIYDVMGRILSSKSVNENKTDLSELKCGNYFMIIYSEHGNSCIRILKE